MAFHFIMLLIYYCPFSKYFVILDIELRNGLQRWETQSLFSRTSVLSGTGKLAVTIPLGRYTGARVWRRGPVLK